MSQRDFLAPVSLDAADRLRANAALLEMIADRGRPLPRRFLRSLAADLREAAESLGDEERAFTQALRRAA